MSIGIIAFIICLIVVARTGKLGSAFKFLWRTFWMPLAGTAIGFIIGGDAGGIVGGVIGTILAYVVSLRRSKRGRS